MRASSPKTRQRLLAAALKHFARRGYAAASVREIVADAGVAKPVLYYHFGSKTGLFKALVESAQTERLRLMQAAAARSASVPAQLEAILNAVFEYTRRNADLMRLAFATAFAPRDELPPGARCLSKARRNFEFVRELIAAGQATGELRRDCDAAQLAFALYGQLMSHVLLQLVVPRKRPDRHTARRVVRLFLEGAAAPRVRRRAPEPTELR